MDLEQQIANLTQRFNTLETEYKSVIEEQKQIIKEHVERIDKLENRVKELETENIALEEKLHKKNSGNSSIPPSKDENRVKPNQSLRKKGNKKIGGQKGHKGNYLKMIDSPDQIVDHKPCYCKCCGKLLKGEMTFIGRRQVVDLPPVTPIVTEHRNYSCTCICESITEGGFPIEASAPVSYGNRISSMIGYLSVRQYLPMHRIREYFKQVYGLKISQGTIVNKLAQFSDQCLPWYERIRNAIQIAAVVGADETGCVVNGKKHWMWTWQNKKLTFIAASHTRGYQAISDNFENGFVHSILISDCWAAQLKTKSKAKQLCMAHLQRELNYFIQLNKEDWSTQFAQLIDKALKLKAKILQHPKQNFDSEIMLITDQSTILLQQQLKGNKKLLAFKKRLLKYKEHLWTFLFHNNVPPDNNGAERAIRNVKVKQKISGQFRSQNGANNFAAIRSVIDTIIKNDYPVFDALIQIPKFVPD